MYYFLIGRTNNLNQQRDISKEAARFDDIIQESFIDTYNNLTLKSISMLKLVNNYCLGNVKFVMKTDDDMYVNVDGLIRRFLTREPKNVLVGSLICKAKPIRSANKWYTPAYMYNGKIYPNYLSGTGYVMSIDLIPKLYKQAFVIPIFHLEDIYITGILPKAIGQKPRREPGFMHIKHGDDPCQFKNVLTVHHLNLNGVRQVHQIMTMFNFSICSTKQPGERKNPVSKFISFIMFNKSKSNKTNVCF